MNALPNRSDTPDGFLKSIIGPNVVIALAADRLVSGSVVLSSPVSYSYLYYIPNDGFELLPLRVTVSVDSDVPISVTFNVAGVAIASGSGISTVVLSLAGMGLEYAKYPATMELVIIFNESVSRTINYGILLSKRAV